MTPFDIQKIISGAATGGWDWFDKADPALAEQLQARQELEGEEGRAIARAWADFYQTPGGRKALERLFDTTLRRTSYFVNLGLDIQSMAVFGAFREGQNALAQEIARQIGRGVNDDVKPRDVT